MTGKNDKKAMPLCSGSFLGHYNGCCRYMPDPVARYCSRISGRLLDRVDLQIEVPALARVDMTRNAGRESSLTVRGTDLAGAHIAEAILHYRRLDRS